MLMFILAVIGILSFLFVMGLIISFITAIISFIFSIAGFLFALTILIIAWVI